MNSLSRRFHVFYSSSLVFKIWLILLALILSQYSRADQSSSPYELKVSIDRVGAGFSIEASYLTNISQCEAYVFLTDYEDVRMTPGLIESKVKKREGNKVTIERLIEERVLLFPLRMHSVLEYTEQLNQGLNFVQTKGDSKAYSGSWRLKTGDKGVQVRYQAFLEPNSSVPKGIIEYFMKNNMQKSFEKLSKSDRPMLHSDQGWQYQMGFYQEALKEQGLAQSMSRKGNCLDNAVMENWFGIMKSEFFYQEKFETIESFKEGLHEYIHYYNHDRIKQKLKGLSPVDYRTQSLVLT